MVEGGEVSNDEVIAGEWMLTDDMISCDEVPSGNIGTAGEMPDDDVNSGHCKTTHKVKIDAGKMKANGGAAAIELIVDKLA